MAIPVMSPFLLAESMRLAEQQRSGDAAGRGPDGVEERDAQRAGLHREHLRGGEVGRAGAGGREEEDDGAEDRQRDGRQPTEHRPRDREQDAGEDVRAGDHADPADGVEERAEQQGAEEVAGREDREVPPGLLDAEERAEGVAVGEEEGVVEERLAHEQREAEDGAPRVHREDRLGDERQADRPALTDRDGLGRRRGSSLPDSREHLPLDVVRRCARPPPRARG